MVPNGWKLESLGKICDINPKKTKKPEDGIVSFIAMNQISEEGQLLYHTPKNYDEVSKGFTSFKDRDVLVAKITPCFENGKGALVDGLVNGVGFGSTEFHVLRAKKNTFPEFIYYLTRTQELRVRGENNMQGSAGHRRVTADYFQAYKVLTPPLPEQRKIATILGTWDKAISTTERLIDNSKQQKKALMQQLLTGKKRLLDDSGRPFEGEWIKTKLIDTASLDRHSFTGGPFGSDLKSSDYTSTGIRIIQLQNIGDGQFHNSYKIFTSEEKADKLISCNIYPGEIIISKMGDPVARATIIPNHHARYLMASDGIRLKVNEEKFDTNYIHEVINGPFFRNIALSKSTGSTRKRIGLTDLRNITFLSPQLPEQQKIASALTNADKEIALLQQQLTDLKQEKKALMQQLLTGKRRVEVNDEAVA